MIQCSIYVHAYQALVHFSTWIDFYRGCRYGAFGMTAPKKFPYAIKLFALPKKFVNWRHWISLGWDWNRGPPDPQPDALTSAPSSYATLHHYITLHHITSHHITSHHITLHHITSHHITLNGITSHHITSLHITSNYITLHSIALHFIAIHAFHCIALHCIALHCITMLYITLHCTALHYIALQCITILQ